MIKKVRKKLGQQKWKLKKKTRETKVWLQKKKKEEKLKTWASSKLKIKKNKKTLFSLLSKNHNSLTTPKKNQSLSSDEKIADSSTWFFFIVVFSVLFFASHCGFFEQFLAKKNLIMLLLDHYYYILLLLLYANVQSVFNAYQITFWIKKKLPCPLNQIIVKCQNTPNFAQCTKILSIPLKTKMKKSPKQNTLPLYTYRRNNCSVMIFYK